MSLMTMVRDALCMAIGVLFVILLMLVVAVRIVFK